MAILFLEGARDTMKTINCKVAVHEPSYFSGRTISITSPKTGVTLYITESNSHYCPDVALKIIRATKMAEVRRGEFARGSVYATAALTPADLRAFLNAQEQAKDDYKDALADSDSCTSCGGAHVEGRLGRGNVCTRGCESTDGECDCDKCSRQGRDDNFRFTLTNYEGGL